MGFFFVFLLKKYHSLIFLKNKTWSKFFFFIKTWINPLIYGLTAAILTLGIELGGIML
jgi:hypothetical protein